MMRLYTKEDGTALRNASKQLGTSDWKILEEQFSVHGGFNRWTRNPTYVPAVLINLARFNDESVSTETKIGRGLRGAVCTAKILEHYSRELANVISETPLCFNSFAGLANANPDIFLSGEFEPGKFIFDDKNNVALQQVALAQEFSIQK